MNEKASTVKLKQGLLDSSNDGLDRTKRSFKGVSIDEWVPSWLRKSRTVPLAICCILLVAALQVLDIVIRHNQGIATRKYNAVNAVTHVPTIAVVILGFAWKALASDAKKITPWSTMSRKWTKSSHSILLDYVTGVEISEVIPAASRRHWAVFFALVIGFVCGALVPLANSLTYTDPLAYVKREAPIERDTAFSFDNTLEFSGNNTLAIALAHDSGKPYAVTSAKDLSNNLAAPWTKDNYVFESFHNVLAINDTATIETTVQALTPGWTCERIVYNEKHSTGYLIANASSFDCPLPVQQQRPLAVDWEATTMGWLNLTKCSNETNDVRLLHTLGIPRDVITRTRATHITSESTIAAICKPHFTIQNALVMANSTTGEVIEYSLTSAGATSIDIKTSIGALWLFLNNTMDGRSRNAIVPDTYRVTMSDQAYIQTNVSHITSFYAHNFLTLYGVDPFTTTLTNGRTVSQTEQYFRDPEQYLEDVAGLCNRTMVQIIHSFARTNMTERQNGTVETQEERIFVRQYSLRTLQALLFLISVVSILEATWVRPRSALQEDPGSLASTSMLLAASNEDVEAIFAREAVSAADHMRHELSQYSWRLHCPANGNISLEATGEETPFLHAVPSLTASTHQHPGHRPVALRLWVRVSITVVFIAILIALALLQARSTTSCGVFRYTRIASDLSSIIPSVVLVLLGYACSGVDSVVRFMAPFNSLWAHKSKKDAMHLDLQDHASPLVLFGMIKKGFGFTVFASSFGVLLIPVIKIAAAGLYGVSISPTTHNVTATLDVTLMDNLEATYNLTDPSSTVQRASQFTEWSTIPTFQVSHRSGILNNLVFSELINVEHKWSPAELLEPEIELRAPAIQVDVQCLPAEVSIYADYIPRTDDIRCWKFSTGCSTAACRQTLNTSDFTIYGSNFLNSYIGLEATASPDATSKCGSSRSVSERYKGTTFYDYDNGYRVLLGDFGSVLGVVKNTTTSGNDSMLFTDGGFNTSLPTVAAVKCYSNFTQVLVDTIFAPERQSGMSTTAKGLTWSPIRYNNSTLVYESSYNRSRMPYWVAPLAHVNVWDKFFSLKAWEDGRTDAPGLMSSKSLWPDEGSSDNFFELLAAYAEYQLGDATLLLRKEHFMQATTAMYTAYTAELLTEIRPFAAVGGSSASKAQSTPATMTYLQSRILQDKTTTIVLEVLLFIMGLCFLWVFCRFPTETILPKNPGSIATRLSLLAQSDLVRRLRDENAEQIRESRVWSEKSSLGWWHIHDGGQSESGVQQGDHIAEDAQDEDMSRGRVGRGMRWGIDIGPSVIKRSWRSNPLS